MHKNCFFYDFEVSFYYFGFKIPHIYKKTNAHLGRLLEIVFRHELDAVVRDPVETFVCQTVGIETFACIAVMNGSHFVLAADLELTDGVQQSRRHAEHPVHIRSSRIEVTDKRTVRFGRKLFFRSEITNVTGKKNSL